MVTSLLEGERITTTIPRAKEARRFTDRMITFAKKGDLGSRRQAARFVNDPKVLQKLFADLGPRYAERNGGYTRIMKLGTRRKGDDASLAILELVEADFTPKPSREKKSLEARIGGAPAQAKTEPEADVEDVKAEEAETPAEEKTE
jgi:large subunit ribosomal protein L17